MQRMFVCALTTTTVSAGVTAGTENGSTRFALRFAAALEADPFTRFDNPAISKLAREIFGTAAGHARDAYDEAEAGFNL